MLLAFPSVIAGLMHCTHPAYFVVDMRHRGVRVLEEGLLLLQYVVIAGAAVCPGVKIGCPRMCGDCNDLHNDIVIVVEHFVQSTTQRTAVQRHCGVREYMVNFVVVEIMS